MQGLTEGASVMAEVNQNIDMTKLKKSHKWGGDPTGGVWQRNMCDCRKGLIICSVHFLNLYWELTIIVCILFSTGTTCLM